MRRRYAVLQNSIIKNTDAGFTHIQDTPLILSGDKGESWLVPGRTNFVAQLHWFMMPCSFSLPHVLTT